MIGSWREFRSARRKGRRDGRAGVPTIEQEALPFDLLEILARSQERVERVVSHWRIREQELEAEVGDLEQRAKAVEATLLEGEARLDAALAEEERHTAEEEEQLARLRTQLEEIPVPGGVRPEPVAELPSLVPIAGGSGLEEVRAPVAAELAPIATADVSWRGIGPWSYWPLIALIVLGEIPLNAFAFRLFHESDLLTYVMTVTVAVGLVSVAHFLGLLLARPERARVERVLVGVFVALPILSIAVISLVRYGYLTDVGGDIGMGPLLGTLAFGLINLLVFGAAVGLSFLRHDPRTLVNRRASSRDAEHERAKVDRQREDQERRRQERERREAEQRARLEFEQRSKRHRASLEERRQEGQLLRDEIAASMAVIQDGARARRVELSGLRARVDAARVAFGDAQRAVEAAAAEKRARWEAADGALRAVRAHRDRLVFAYCSANVRARADRLTPVCLQDVPALEVPAEFGEPIREGV